MRLARAAELVALPGIRASLRAGLAERGVEPGLIDDVVLAIEEAAMNVIRHGYRGMDPGSLIVEIEVAPASIVATLTDFGHPFEPFDPPAPDVQAIVEGTADEGFGLFLIHRLMDAVDYRSDELGNHLVIVKRR